jgi:hypothetical protein
MAWHNATLLAQENIELCTTIAKEDKKHKHTKKVIKETASFIRGEAHSLIDDSIAANQLAEDLASMEDNLPHRYTPPMCSTCNTVGHD